MKQPGAVLLLVIFVLLISFVVASQEAKNEGFVSVALTGAANVNGSGVFKFRVNKQERQLCYELSTSNLSAATAATVTLGDTASNATVIISLDPPRNGHSQGCVSSEADILADIAAHGSRYYVNVMNAEFPNGAIRGELR